MALFFLRKLILQTHMRSHPVELDVWFFVFFHYVCVRTAKALLRMCGCAGSPEPSLVAHVISTIISWAGSFHDSSPRKNVARPEDRTRILLNTSWTCIRQSYGPSLGKQWRPKSDCSADQDLHCLPFLLHLLALLYGKIVFHNIKIKMCTQTLSSATLDWFSCARESVEISWFSKSPCSFWNLVLRISASLIARSFRIYKKGKRWRWANKSI